MTFDPTQNRIRTDLLAAYELAALKAAKHGWEYLYQANGVDEWIDMPDTPSWHCGTIYRAKPAPAHTITFTTAELLAAAAELPEVQGLAEAVERLNAACDAMWNDGDRLEENPIVFGPLYRLKEVHMKAISEAQQALPSALAPFARKGE